MQATNPGGWNLFAQSAILILPNHYAQSATLPFPFKGKDGMGMGQGEDRSANGWKHFSKSAGGRPAADHFLLRGQNKVIKEKAAPVHRH